MTADNIFSLEDGDNGEECGDVATTLLDYATKFKDVVPQKGKSAKACQSSLKSSIGDNRTLKKVYTDASRELKKSVSDFTNGNACLLYTSPSPRD